MASDDHTAAIQLEPITDKYGTIERHIGECFDCGYTVKEDGSYEGFEYVEDTLCRHIGGPGAPCQGFRTTAVYEDGGERRV